jgi:hypothetical protein
MEIVDGVILNYLLYHIIESHGTISPPSNEQVEIKDAGKKGQYLHVAQPDCKQGNLSITLTVIDGALLGIDFKSPRIDELNEKMFADLFADKNNEMTKFAKFYSKSCESMIRCILGEKDTKAFEMFHPEIQKQIGSEPFSEVFKAIRDDCGTKSVKVELETAGVDIDESGNGNFFTISHRLAGPNGKVLVTHKLQFIGMKAYFVAVSIEPVPEE